MLEEVPEDVSNSWIDELTIRQFNEELKGVFPYIYRLVSEANKTKELGPDDIIEASGYEGGDEPQKHSFRIDGDYDEDRGITEKETEMMTKQLVDMGLKAQVEPDENVQGGIIVHTMSPENVIASALEKLEYQVEAIAQEGKVKGMVMDMEDLSVEDLANSKRLLICCSTWGEGDQPTNAEELYGPIDYRANV